jgi:cytosine/uracil/thiamine/allantoin permease
MHLRAKSWEGKNFWCFTVVVYKLAPTAVRDLLHCFSLLLCLVTMLLLQVVAAEGSSFVALHDSRLQFTSQRWTFGPADCAGAWAPLWACMRTYTTAAQVGGNQNKAAERRAS